VRPPKPATYDVEVKRDPIADEVTAARFAIRPRVSIPERLSATSF